MAAGTTGTGCDRHLSHLAATAGAAAVRRAAAPAHARDVRGRVDRAERRRRPAPRAGALPGRLLPARRHPRRTCWRRGDRATEHPELGATAWYAVRHGDHETPRGAWEHTALPGHAAILADRLAFAWHAMDAFYEEDERILGHAADAYHRIDIRQTTRDLTVHAGDRLIAQTQPRASAVRVRFRPALVRPPSRRRRRGACSRSTARRSARTRACAATTTSAPPTRPAGPTSSPTERSTGSPTSSRSSPTRSRSRSTGSDSQSVPGQHVVAHGPDRGLTPDEATAAHRPAVRA